MQLNPGTIFDGRFEVLDQLGEGGMGLVIKARQTDMDRIVALKLLKKTVPTDRAWERFKTEAKVMHTLQHQNIVSVYRLSITDDGQPYIVMEYFKGESLANIINRRGFLPEMEACQLFLQACEALEHAHQNGVIHRDVKPGNILVSENNGEKTVKIADFGIAKLVDESNAEKATQTSLLAGSAFYLSPGQCEGRRPDQRSDVYALGCSLYETLAGVPPFIGETFFETLSKQVNDEAKPVKEVNPNSDISAGLQQIIRCAMVKDVNGRYQSISQLKADLASIVAGKKPRNTQTILLKKKTRPKQLIAMGIACLLIAAMIIFGLITVQNKPTPDAETSKQAQSHHDKARRLEDAGQKAQALAEIDKSVILYDRLPPTADGVDAAHFQAKLYGRALLDACKTKASVETQKQLAAKMHEAFTHTDKRLELIIAPTKDQSKLRELMQYRVILLDDEVRFYHQVGMYEPTAAPTKKLTNLIIQYKLKERSVDHAVVANDKLIKYYLSRREQRPSIEHVQASLRLLASRTDKAFLEQKREEYNELLKPAFGEKVAKTATSTKP